MCLSSKPNSRERLFSVSFAKNCINNISASKLISGHSGANSLTVTQLLFVVHMILFTTHNSV